VAAPGSVPTAPPTVAVAVSREPARRPRPRLGEPSPPQPGEGVDYTIGDGVARAVEGHAYDRLPGDPLHRPLQIYALDPSLSRLEGSTATVNVPFEPLEPGFKGRLFEVDAHDGGTHQDYRHLDLDDRVVLLGNGLRPSPADPLFHQQMLYAVGSLVYAAFKKALGRHLAWGFEQPDTAQRRTRLRLRPYAMLEDNAYYDETTGELAFGYVRVEPNTKKEQLPRGLVFTSLSHDIIAHELTHALLDGLRAHFMTPSGPDVLAFHEGFADLVAIFQHFSYPQVVETAIGRARGELKNAAMLANLAQQFGQAVGEDEALRTAIDIDAKTPRFYDPDLEEHDLGAVLESAVFHAFISAQDSALLPARHRRQRHPAARRDAAGAA
jgi:hypothetical protein